MSLVDSPKRPRSTEPRAGDEKKVKKMKKTIEETYTHLTPEQHLLHRPEVFIGSMNLESDDVQWVTVPAAVVTDAAAAAAASAAPVVEQRKVSYVPALRHIIDEIIVNAADNKTRDPSMSHIEIDIDAEKGMIRVYNDGASIPVEMHKEHHMWVPAFCFSKMLTGSNFDDDENLTVGGRFGVGSKGTSHMSKWFELSCCDGKKTFLQTWTDNMSKTSGAIIKDTKSKKTWLCVRFIPDFKRFGIDTLKFDADMVSLVTRRALDLAGTVNRMPNKPDKDAVAAVLTAYKAFKPVTVKLNNAIVPIRSFEEYMQMFATTGSNALTSGPLAGAGTATILYANEKTKAWRINDVWQYGVMVQTHDRTHKFQHMSFVNNVHTSEGGTHVACVVGQIVDYVTEYMTKKLKCKEQILPDTIKRHLFLFLNTRIVKPTFTTQTKVKLTLPKTKFGFAYTVPEAFLKELVKNTCLTDVILAHLSKKGDAKLAKTDGSKKKSLPLISKLEDANEAGSATGYLCTLFLVEGDSAKAFVMSGLSVVGRDRYGVFPLKGKLLNVRNANKEQLANNIELATLKQIIGLESGVPVTNYKKQLRYGRVCLVTDADVDGIHIRTEFIDAINVLWPTLFALATFLWEFITPIIVMTHDRTQKKIRFYSLAEYNTWVRQAPQHGSTHGWSREWKKGLGSSTAEDAQEYFADIDAHMIQLLPTGPEDQRLLHLAFAGNQADARKEWLATYQMTNADASTAVGYETGNKNKKTKTIPYVMNREWILYGNDSNIRGIPWKLDKLKRDSTRKILFACFKRKLVRMIKVAQLAGYVSEHALYHHGEESLVKTIIGMAQTFVGSNNVPLLTGVGQFGSRAAGGKDAASGRYIFVSLSPVTRKMFPISDDPILKHQTEDDTKIQPEHYLPIIPNPNPCEGMGTGWSTNLPGTNPRTSIAYLRMRLTGASAEEANARHPVHPWYRGFKGVIVPRPGHATTYSCMGRVEELSPTKLHICELPIDLWTNDQKANLQDLQAKGVITSFKEYHNDVSVSFVVHLTAEQRAKLDHDGIYTSLKLITYIITSNMVMFNVHGQLTRYATLQDIREEFYLARLPYFELRKQYIIRMLTHEIEKIKNKIRFIQAVWSKRIATDDRSKKDIVHQIERDNYYADNFQTDDEDPDPAAQDQDQDLAAQDHHQKDPKHPYQYLTSINIFGLTKESIVVHTAALKAKEQKLAEEQAKTIETRWLDDLDAFEKSLDEFDVAQAKAEALILAKIKKQGKTPEIPAGRWIQEDPPAVAGTVKKNTKRKRDDEQCASSTVPDAKRKNQDNVSRALSVRMEQDAMEDGEEENDDDMLALPAMPAMPPLPAKPAGINDIDSDDDEDMRIGIAISLQKVVNNKKTATKKTPAVRTKPRECIDLS